MSECFDKFLSSLSKAALVGLLGVLTTIKSQLELDRVKLIARSAKLSNVKNATKNLASALATNALQEVKGAINTFNLDAFKGCDAVDSMRKVFSDSVGASTGKTGQAQYEEAKVGQSKQANDDKKSKLDSDISFIDKLILDIQQALATRS